MSVLIVDNYDSFTYNLVELIRSVSGISIQVEYNDTIDIQTVNKFNKIILSPGPGLPQQAGKTCEIIKNFAGSKDILGICLGHQAIASVFGGTLYNLDTVFHGITAEIEILDTELSVFKNIPQKFLAGLYHSWAVSKNNLPDCLLPVAISEQNIIMGLKHKYLNIIGLQFHPESIMTPVGRTLIKNWLEL